MQTDDYHLTLLQIGERRGGTLGPELNHSLPLPSNVVPVTEGGPDTPPMIIPLPPVGTSEPPAKRVLVVEDEPDNRESLRRLLTRWGFEVRVAKDGPTALALVPGFAPHAALIDIGLPRMDGHELTRRLKRVAGCAATVCIAVSGWARAADHDRSLAAGLWRHLVKPVEPAVLKAVLDAATADWDRAA